MPNVISIVFDSAPPWSACAGRPPASIVSLCAHPHSKHPPKMSTVWYCALDTCCTAKIFSHQTYICNIQTSIFLNPGCSASSAHHWRLSTISLTLIHKSESSFKMNHENEPTNSWWNLNLGADVAGRGCMNPLYSQLNFQRNCIKFWFLCPQLGPDWYEKEVIQPF